MYRKDLIASDSIETHCLISIDSKMGDGETSKTTYEIQIVPRGGV